MSHKPGNMLPLLSARPAVTRQTVNTHRAFVHQAAKLVAALLRVARATSGLVESNGSILPGLWLMSPAGWLPRTAISSGTLCLAIEYGLPFLCLSSLFFQKLTETLVWVPNICYNQILFRNLYTVTQQLCGCDLNPGPSAPESSMLTTRLPSHR